ncbi:MAG: helix-hairpin-helix domain-containing protein [Taibaiella sp.]|nr:helix-hairpin-helix domain-containing protein [Taibaiella sp.]
MKNALKSYAAFTRTERVGIMILCGLILLLIAVRFTMQYWVRPANNDADQRNLNIAWQAFQKKNEEVAVNKYSVKSSSSSIAITPNSDTIHTAPSKIHATGGKLFYFDPNTLDSSGFRKLGLKEKTTAILLHWRAKGKHFYNKDELKKVYTLSPEEYARLEPYIKIAKN